jgi:predicted regulator of Ras-like GTPase activity (Roadblock/LC7/MglB family)
MSSNAIAALGPDDLRRLESLLDGFLDGAGARCAFLLDRHGRPVTDAGDREGVDPTSFASLAAADFEASGQLARLLGEAEFNALYHRGLKGSLYLVDIAGTVILAVVFDGRTTLGRVRLAMRRAHPEIRAVLSELEGRPSGTARLESGWEDAAVDEIDRLFAG